MVLVQVRNYYFFKETRKKRFSGVWESLKTYSDIKRAKDALKDFRGNEKDTNSPFIILKRYRLIIN